METIVEDLQDLRHQLSLTIRLRTQHEEEKQSISGKPYTCKAPTDDKKHYAL